MHRSWYKSAHNCRLFRTTIDVWKNLFRSVEVCPTPENMPFLIGVSTPARLPQTHRQDRLQYTAPLASAQSSQLEMVTTFRPTYKPWLLTRSNRSTFQGHLWSCKLLHHRQVVISQYNVTMEN